MWCSITGFGAASSRPGYDFVVQAESGWMSITGEPDGAPMKTGVALSDILTGKDAAAAILAALVGRDRGLPIERRLTVSLAASATAALINVAQNELVSGVPGARWGNAHPNLVPYQLFEAADRPLVLAVGSDKQWTAAMNALGLPDLAADPALRTNAGRIAERTRIVSVVAEKLRGDRATVWLSLLDAAGVPCGLVNTVQEALEKVEASPLTGLPPATGGTIRLEPPLLNAHSKLVRKHKWSAFTMLPILA